MARINLETGIYEDMPTAAEGRITPEQRRFVDMYLQEYPFRPTVGKKGEGDQDLEYYSRIPGERQLVNGQYWIHNPDNPEQPWKPYTAEHAIDPRTGQVYELVPDEGVEGQNRPAGSLAEIPPRLAELGVGPFRAMGRMMERARLGLETTLMQDARDAREAAGLAIGGSAFARTTREGMAAARQPAAEAVRNADAPVAAPAHQPQYRIRPTDIRPQGHMTPQQFETRVAQRAADREARIAAARPEVDEAGFYINALERAKRELPETATAGEMRQALKDIGVEDAEIAMLGLDRLLMGDAGVAAETARFANRNLGIAASEYGKALAKARKHPENVGYAEAVTKAREAIPRFRDEANLARKQAEQARREHIKQETENFRNAERYLKSVNNEIRALRKEGSNSMESVEWGLGVNLLDERISARKSLAEARTALENAAASDPALRTVTKEQILQHIRENRPQMAFEVRESAGLKYGQMAEPIRRIQEPGGFGHPLRLALERRGIEPAVANDAAERFMFSEPTEWGPLARSLGDHIRQPTIIREAVEEAAGASITDMAAAFRHEANRGATPRYPMAIHDSQNPTLREVAVVLKGPWSVRRELSAKMKQAQEARDKIYQEYVKAPKDSPAEKRLARDYDAAVDAVDVASRDLNNAPKPPFISGHWSGDVAPIGHMQVTIQRMPAAVSDDLAANIKRAKNNIDRLEREKADIQSKLQEYSSREERVSLMRRRNEIDSALNDLRRDMPKPPAADDTIYMGNQFQSDWSGSGISGFRSPAVEKRLDAARRQLKELEAKRTELENATNEVRRRDVGYGNRLPREYRDANTDAPFNQRDAQIRQLTAEHSRVNRQIGHLRDIVDELDQLPSYHALVANTQAWLRPTLEQFVEQGIRSGARYLGIPSGATVSAKNYIKETTQKFYDETLRRELRHVMERRGLKYDERQIDMIYNPTGDKVFPGTWYVIELPQNTQRAPGVRLMTNPAAGAASLLQTPNDVEQAQYLTPSQVASGPEPNERRYTLEELRAMFKRRPEGRMAPSRAR